MQARDLLAQIQVAFRAGLDLEIKRLEVQRRNHPADKRYGN